MEARGQDSPDEDEISLLDLLVVLLKWRKLIVGAAVAALLIALAYALIMPRVQKADIRPVTTITLELIPVLNPQTTDSAFAYDLAIMALHYLNDAEFLDSLGGAKSSLTAQTFMSNGKTAVRVTAGTTDDKTCEAYLQLLLAELDTRLKRDLPLTTVKDVPFPLLALADQKLKVSAPVQKRYATTAAVGFFAVLFLSVFLAFVLEYIARIRSDAESMAKIKQALK